MHLLELKQEIARSLGDIGVNVDYWDIEETKFADLVFKAFRYKDKDRISDAIKGNEFVHHVDVSGPYLNIFLKRDKFSRAVLSSMTSGNLEFQKNGKTLILEHTSVNPTGPIHIGRFRNPVIGDSLRRIFEFLGWDVTVQYYVNDVGRQVALIALAREMGIKPDPEIVKRYLQYADKQDFQTLFIYVPAFRSSEEDEAFKSRIDEMMKKAESGDKHLLETLKNTAEFCLDGQVETLKRCGFKYDKFVFESDFIRDGLVWGVIDKLKETGKTVKTENGALAIDLRKFGSPREFTVLLRSDGTSVYLTRDVAYHIEKLKHGDLVINVLGEDHKVEFSELKILLNMLGQETDKLEAVHYSFVSLEGKRMSTRRGEMVPLDQVLDDGAERALSVIEMKNPGLPDKERVAEQIGVGAIKYSLIRQDPVKKVVFRWESALDFEGDTGPYLQYAYARSRSILRKSSKKPRVPSGISINDDEWSLIMNLSKFQEVVFEAGKQRKPNIIANYAYQLSKEFNEFYHKNRVIGSENEEFRLALVLGFSRVLKRALYLLGIDAPERM